MNESSFLSFWSQLFPLGKCLIVALSFSLLSLRFLFLPFSDKIEKQFRATALGLQFALVFWPIFPSFILRGRVDLALWFYFPFLFLLGFILFFIIQKTTKTLMPIRDFSLFALLGLFCVPWAPYLGEAFTNTSYLLWGIFGLVVLLNSDGLWWQRVFLFPACVFFASFFGSFFPSLAPLLGIFFFSFWLGGLFKETLILFSFFPEATKRFIPTMIAFSFALALSLAFA